MTGNAPNVLYLDFDGVLHHGEVYWSPRKGPYMDPTVKQKLFAYAGLLEEILLPYPNLAIVLSTSWVLKYGCHGAARRLPHSLRQRVIGATFHTRMNREDFDNASRGMQVWADVYRRQPTDWLALDDDFLQWPAWCRDKLIRTLPHLGLNSPETRELLRSKLLSMSKVAPVT